MLSHPILMRYWFSEPQSTNGFSINSLGSKTRLSYLSAGFEHIDKPQPNAELFEWIDMLDAVYTAKSRVTVADFGAGYGRVLVNAAQAARQLGKHFMLIGVEAERTHFEWMLEHFADNGVPPSQYMAVRAPVTAEPRTVFFTEGHPDEWYGQSVIESEHAAFGNWLNARVVTLQSVAASTVLHDFDRIDALHMDIQGEEVSVFKSMIDLVQSRVRRVHIGTHSREIDGEFEALFAALGWTPRFRFPCGAKGVQTDYGVIDFCDGVQSWINPELEAKH
jgi:FkbM family methyltransferase